MFGEDSKAQVEFRRRVEDANKGMEAKIRTSVLGNDIREALSALGVWLIYVAIFALLTLQFYWDMVKGIFNDIDYDSTIAIGQIAIIIALISLRQSIKK